MIAQFRFSVNMDNLDLLQIHQVWTDLREARVKDGFIFRVSRYFIDHWLQLLGPKAAWAVVDLQQRCYLDKADFCLVSLKDLCAVTSVRSATTMQAIVDQPLMRWFFGKQTTRQCRGGKVVRGKNRYTLQMGDPLTPRHQGQVAWLLAERLRDGTVPTVHGLEDLVRLVNDLPPLSTLPTKDLSAWATNEPLNLRQIAFRALKEGGIDHVPAKLADEAALQRAFADAQARITQPARIALATHYFRTAWVPQLGATNAWLIMILRSRCYWNKESGEVRDICVMSSYELADLLGTSTRTVTRGLQNPLVQKFVTAQERVYERRPSDGRKTPARTRYQVHLTLDPLTPPDEAVFAEILLSDAARYGLDPLTGQMNMLDILDMMGQMTSDEITHRRSQGDKTEIRAPGKVKSDDKTGIRETRPEAPDSGSSDRNENREHLPKTESASETESDDQTEIRSTATQPTSALSSLPEGCSEGISSDKNGIRESLSDKSGFRSGESSDKIDTTPAESSDKTGKQYLNTPINTEDENEQQQQYSTAAAAIPPLHQTLIQYGIEEPALSQILANERVTPELACAWMLYADNEPGLKRKVGYVVQRLIHTPPDVPADPDLLLAACLTDDERTGFAQRRALELRMGASVSFSDERREAQYGAWLRFYGSEKDASRGGEPYDETAVGLDGRRASRWQPDVG
jgi:hypothetical protein